MASHPLTSFIFVLVGTGALLTLLFAAPGLIGADTFLESNSTSQAFNMSADLVDGAYDTPTPFLSILILVIAAGGIIGGTLWFRSIL